MVLVAIVGTGGLRPALAAIKAGKDLAVASKEILVMAGGILMGRAGGKNGPLFAVGLRAQRDLSVPRRQTVGRCQKDHPYGIWRPFPRNTARGIRFDHAG